MQAGSKHYTLNLDIDQISYKGLSDICPMLLFMWRSHHMDTLIRSPFFRLLRVEDKCYQMIVRKCAVTDKVTIKFTKFQTIKPQES